MENTKWRREGKHHQYIVPNINNTKKKKWGLKLHGYNNDLIRGFEDLMGIAKTWKL